MILTGAYLGYLPDHQAEPWVAAERLHVLLLESCGFLTSFVSIIRRDRRGG